jgi:hypothetical protein
MGMTKVASILGSLAVARFESFRYSWSFRYGTGQNELDQCGYTNAGKLFRDLWSHGHEIGELDDVAVTGFGAGDAMGALRDRLFCLEPRQHVEQVRA